jgi:hypothetical protein
MELSSLLKKLALVSVVDFTMLYRLLTLCSTIRYGTSLLIMNGDVGGRGRGLF